MMRSLLSAACALAMLVAAAAASDGATKNKAPSRPVYMFHNGSYLNCSAGECDTECTSFLATYGAQPARDDYNDTKVRAGAGGAAGGGGGERGGGVAAVLVVLLVVLLPAAACAAVCAAFAPPLPLPLTPRSPPNRAVQLRGAVRVPGGGVPLAVLHPLELEPRHADGRRLPLRVVSRCCC